ncbi:MAG: HIT domain-containing protein [Nitrospiraceae bacterium]|nr:HIT domain-containing protein [Nitrospiraceae bacterium]
MEADCLFCKMVRGEIAVTPVFQNDSAIVIRDIAPKAPVHLLVIPRRHAKDMVSWSLEGPLSEWGEVMALSVQAATGSNLMGDGFRLVINTGGHGGQTVDHLHLHLLGGRPFSWPPG